MRPYDHNIKAGNQGDLIKHPALMAALRALGEAHAGSEFSYIDLFAGYGINPLTEGNEWQQGIGQIHQTQKAVQNVDLQNYRDWYLSRPALSGGVYPGSALIASESLRAQGIAASMTLYDISAPALESLKRCFGGTHHNIVPRPALPEDTAISTGDFIFIDPPRLYSEQNPTCPHLNYLLEFEQRMARPAVMFWLPITGTGETGGETELSQQSVRQLKDAGYQIDKVRWADHQRTVGCIIASRLPACAQQRVSDAIKAVTELTGWQHQYD